MVAPVRTEASCIDTVGRLVCGQAKKTHLPAAAVMAWVEFDSSDDDDSDILTQTLADELALMLVE